MRRIVWLGLLLACSEAPRDEPTAMANASASARPNNMPSETASAPAPRASLPAPPPCGEVPAEMSCVPAGEVVLGIARDEHRCAQGGQPLGVKASLPLRRVALAAFLIDRTEVTNEAYERCAAAGGCAAARPIYPGFRSPRLPVTGVSWHDADRYCRWADKRLPTEAEWEKAARGPEGEAEPWGDDAASCARAVIEDEHGRGCGEGQPGKIGSPLPVGSRAAGRYGLFDMVGNAEEWVADWWSEAPDDPRGPCGGAAFCPGHAYRVVRGGSWYWPAEHATGYHRRPHLPDNPPRAFHHFGFRCAKSLR